MLGFVASFGRQSDTCALSLLLSLFMCVCVCLCLCWALIDGQL